MKLNKCISVAMVACLLVSGNVYASASNSVWKKMLKVTGIALGAVTAVVSVGTIVATVASAKDPGATSEPQSDSGNAQTSEPQSDSGQSNSGQSESRQQGKGQGVIVQLKEEYVFFMNDYANAMARGESINVEDIKQPFLKEFYSDILGNDGLVAEIEQTIEGASLIEKINKVLASEMF